MATTRLETRLTARDETQRAFRNLQSNLNTVNTAFVNVAKVAAGLGAVFAGVFVRDLIEVNKQFQSLKASLITFTGSVETADSAFKILKDFAKTTPFSLQEVVGSFNLLVAQGIKPTEKQLMAFADISGGTSKSIIQFAEAVADASVGEFERLKEFGIKASKEGDKVTLKIGDMTKTVNNDSASIVAALTDIANVKFAGGAARQADTLGGAMTNLRDTMDDFMFSIGEAGFAGELTKAIKALTTMIQGNDDLAKSISDRLSDALYGLVAAIRFVVNNFDTLLMAMQIVFGFAIIKRIINTGKAVIKFGRAVVSSTYATKLFSTLMGGSFTKNLKKGATGLIMMAGGAIVLSEGLEKAIEELGENVSLSAILDGAYRALGLTTDSLERSFNELTSGTEMMDQQFVQNSTTLSDIYDKMNEADGGTKTLTKSTGDLTDAFKEIKKRLDPFGSALADTKDQANALKLMLNAGKITNEEYEDSINAIAREALGLDTTLVDLKRRQDIADKAFKAGIITGDEYAKIISTIKGEIIDYNAENEKTFGAGAIKGVKDYYQSISNNAENMSEFVSGAFSDLEGTLSDFFMTGKVDFKSFTNAIKKGLADLAAKAIITTGIKFLGKVFPSLKFAEGGLVPGSGGPKADDVLARVSSGEYVIKASSVSKFGTGFFDALNAGQMPSGNMPVDAGVMDSITPGFGLGGLFKGIGKIIGGIVDAIKNAIKGVIKAIEKVVGAISDAIKGLIEGIMSGDLLTIASLAAGFILPGVGTAIMGNLAAGSGLVASITSGISSSFAAGILGAGNLTAIATQIGIELAKGAFTDQLSAAITKKILKTTGEMADAGGLYEKNRADRFKTLFNEASPYLAAMNGANVHAGDNVKVGERGPEMFIPQRDGTIAPIKGNASELIGAVNEMKDEIVSLRRQMSRLMSAGQLAGVRS